jgi:hypothetical protein
MVFPFGKPQRVYTRSRNYLSSFSTMRLPSIYMLFITSCGGTTTKQGVLAEARCCLLCLLAAGVWLLSVCVSPLHSSHFIGTREQHSTTLFLYYCCIPQPSSFIIASCLLLLIIHLFCRSF